MPWSILLRPKVVCAIAGLAVLVLLGFYINSEITAFGKAQYKAGQKACQAAVSAKAEEARSVIEDIQDAAKEEANETDAIFTDVSKNIAASDATVVAENTALKTQIAKLKERIDNAPLDMSVCALHPISDDSLSIHTEIDRLLSDG